MDKETPQLHALASVISEEITSARGYATDSTSSAELERPLDYLQGKMDRWLEHDENRSGVVSFDVADTVGWIMPDLVRLFFAGDRMVDYLAASPEDEDFTEQASDYINHVFLNDCRGYFVAWDAMHDGLTVRNGIIKCWWQDEPSYITRSLTGLDDEQLLQIIDNPDIEVLEYSSRSENVSMGFEMVEMGVHDIKVRQLRSTGRIRIRSLPREGFLIDKDATDIHDARFLGHRETVTRSDLVKDGYDREVVDMLPTAGGLVDLDTARSSREPDDGEHDLASIFTRTDRAMELIDVYECYVQYDLDDDGIAEWLKVVMAGHGSSRNILEVEEWGDPLPFFDLNPERVPHRFEGRSIYDQTHDVQDIKSTLLRGVMDNLYDTLTPERVVVEKEIIDVDALLNPRYGEVHRVKTNPDAIRDLPKAVIAPDAFNMLGYWDSVVQRRTGVSQLSSAMDPDRLQNQSATVANLTQAQSHSKVELIGRNYAAGGFKELFKAMLRLTVNHQDRPLTVKLRNEWVTINPSQWNPEMDAVVNTGLGTGHRQRDLAMLFQILQIQKEIVAEAGPDNPFVKPSQLHNTIEKIVHAAGIPAVDMFFTEVSDEDAAQWYQQKMQEQQAAAQEPDAATKALVEVENTKAMARLEEAKMKAHLQAVEDQHRIEMEQLKLENDALKVGVENQFDWKVKGRELQEKAIQGERDRDVDLLKLQLEAYKLNHAHAPGEKPTKPQNTSEFRELIRSFEEAMARPRVSRFIRNQETGEIEAAETR